MTASRWPAAGLPGIRREAFALSVLLLVQYGLGIAVNLSVTLPHQDQGRAGQYDRQRARGRIDPCVLGAAVLVIALVITIQATARHRGIDMTTRDPSKADFGCDGRAATPMR